MALTPDRSRLRYVDADDLDDATIDFDGLKVRNPAGEKLGKVDGAIVDVETGRPYYVVVDSGGWFHAKRYLLPIGHVRLDHDNDALVADLTRERIDRFPGFDADEFRELSDDELERMDTQIASCCCPGETASSGGERWSHHRVPDWWNPSYYTPGRERTAASAGVPGTRREIPITDRDRDSGGEPTRDARERDLERQRVGDAGAVVAREGGDASPHPGGRAEPGDVIGVETGGEQTHLGETANPEDERRRAAEKAAGKQADADLDRAKRD